MTTKTEALRMALVAYIKAGYGNSTDFYLQSVAYEQALQALAQPEQIVELCRFVADIEAAHGIKGTQS